MAHIDKKIKKGKTYYYIRKIKRVNEKPKVVNQVYLGTMQKIPSIFRQSTEVGYPQKIDSKRFGALFLACLLEEKLNTIGIIDSKIKRETKKRPQYRGIFFLYLSKSDRGALQSGGHLTKIAIVAIILL